MKAIKLIGIAAITFAITSCTSSGADKSASEANHDSTACTEHEHHNHAHETEHHHHHGVIVVGIAQDGDYQSGKISILPLNGGEKKEFDYSKSNQDQIAAWQAGDTVSIFIDHHHHGEVAHDSITAIKFGIKECSEAHNHEHEHHSHENCNEHNHNH